MAVLGVGPWSRSHCRAATTANAIFWLGFSWQMIAQTLRKPYLKKCTFIALESHLTLNQDQLFLLHGTPHSLSLAQSGLAIFEMPSWPRNPVICPNWRGPKIYLPKFLKTAPSAEPPSQMKAYLGRHIWSSEQIVLKEPTIQCLVSTVAHICKYPGSSWRAVKAAGF